MTYIERLHKVCQTDTDECVEWFGSLNTKGYGVVKKANKLCLAHREAFNHVNGFYPEVVMHTCDNRKCVNVKHLQAGDTTTNVKDKVSKGRQQKGTEVHTSKLSEEDVLEIQQLRNSMTQGELASRYGVSQATVSRLLNGVSWSHM